ncbi:MAG: hypothetical protein H6R05_702 [Burkholderiaceae bacterium]|nr:hypothetical protein [Burkholderiaceae bacterium]
MNPHKDSRNMGKQSGVALFIVLILLLVLAAASVALLQNQRWAVRQTADRLDVLERNAQSNKVHDQCVAKFRNALETSSTELVGYEGRNQILDIQDSKWGANSECLYEWYRIPAQTTPDVVWTPHVRINSRVQVKGVWAQEMSEWRYPACDTTSSTDPTHCVPSATAFKVANIHQTLNAQFDPTRPVLTVRTPVAIQ